jgi:mycothiol synthase
MIKYEWRNSLYTHEAAELSDLLDRAAAHDAAAEYSTIAFSDVEAVTSQRDSRVLHLIIWMLPYARATTDHDQPEAIAGVIRLVRGTDGSASATVVIDPRFRSIGITTLLLEQVGLDVTRQTGWMDTGVHAITAWAQGNHPAASRLGNRFLIPRTRRIWKLIRTTESDADVVAAPALEPTDASHLDGLAWASDLKARNGLHALRERGRVVGVAELNASPVVSEEFGRCLVIDRIATAPSSNAHTRRRLLVGAAAAAHDAGFTGVIMHVDSDDTEQVNSCRLAGFQHDRTDVRFQLGGRQ